VNFCGTSSATPIVSGIAGLAHTLEPELTKDTLVQALRTAAVSIGSSVLYGRVEAAGAIEALGLMPPLNEERPKIVGTKRVGSVLTARNGRWAGSPTSFSYGWLRCNSSGRACKTIANATGSTYRVKSRDLRSRLRVRVTATNANGARSARSLPTRTIEPAEPTVQQAGTTEPVDGGSGPPPSGEPTEPTEPTEPPPGGAGETEPTPVDTVMSEIKGVVETIQETPLPAP
jgi:hypothetical protein